MDKKKVAIFIDSLSGGGAERIMLTLAERLVEDGHIVHFFLLEEVVDYQPHERIAWHSLLPAGERSRSIKSGRLKGTAQQLSKLVSSVTEKVGNFDLHLSNLDSTNVVMNECGFPNTYYVIHNSIKQELKRAAKSNPFKYLQLRKFKKVLDNKHLICVSEGVAEEVKLISWLNPESVQTIYNPCNFDTIKGLSEQPSSQIPTEPYLIHIGRVVRQKRHDILFDAIKLVPDIKLVLLCKNVKKVRKLAEKKGILDRIITPAFQENPYNWIKNAKLMVFSSEFEGLGMVLIESLICGTPVVSTDCDFGPNEIMTGELQQYLAKVNDPKNLADKINMALSVDLSVSNLPIFDKVDLDTISNQYLNLAKQPSINR